MDLLVDVLAAHRLVRLAQTDTVPPLPEIRAHLETAHPDATWLELLYCPWCLSIWVAAAVGLARAVTPGVWRPVARLLAISSAVGLITERQPH